jgi:hypothetical protein
MRVVDDLADQKDAAVRRSFAGPVLVRRLIGVVDRAVDAVTEAEVLRRDAP